MNRLQRAFLAFVACVTIGHLAAPAPACAQIGSERYSSIIVEAGSGNVLSAANPDELRFPASLTKMMTLYLLFEAVRDRRVNLNQYVPVTWAAAAMPPTKLGLVPGSLITVEQAVFGLVTKSANDAACALGEMLGGDEDRFAQMMTLRAHALGMTRTTFRNASGLPDWNQVTTARDMAVLARHLIQDFPGFYHYFSTPSFIYAGRFVPNHQRLLQSYPGADGLKTGYTEAAGYNVVTSAMRADTRLIGVVLGAANGGERDAHMAMLLDQGFDHMGVPAPTRMGALAAARREPAFRIPALIGVAHAAASTQFLTPPSRSIRAFSAPASRRAPEQRAVHASTPASRSLPLPLRIYQPQATRSPSLTRTAHGSAWTRFPG